MIEPQTRERMYANVVTGECVWQPPPGVRVKRAHFNQWWELFDKNTDRYYYYNVAQNQTVWHRPRDADIVPLTQLQALKERSAASADFKPVVWNEGPPTMTKQFAEQRPMRPMPISATSPQLSAKHRHSARQTDSKSDRSTDVSSAGSASPTQFVGPPNDIYGYVHRGKPSVNLQRSLESHASPRTCDILLDLERSSRSQNSDVGSTGSGGPRTPDLMSRSCHGHFQGEMGAQVNVGLVDCDWRVNAESPYSDLSAAMAAQITPRTKPRAFPRTNPRVGVARTDGFSTCRRGNEQSVYRHQGAYDMYGGQPVMHSGIGPAATVNVDYSTLRSYRPAPSHGHDIGDFAYYPVTNASEFAGRDVVMRSQLPGSGHRVQHSPVRRGSEPFYVNVPHAGLKVTVRYEDTESELQIPDDDSKYYEVGDNSSEILTNDHAEVFDEVDHLLSAKDAKYDIDRLSDLSLGSSVFIEPTPLDALPVASKVHKPSPPLAKTSVHGPPDLLHRAVIVGQKLAEANGSCRSESPVSVEKCRSPPAEQASDNTSSNSSFGTPALTRRFQYRMADAPVKLYSESDGDAYNQEMQQGCGDAEFGSVTEFDLELFAATRLNEHRKGLLGRQLPIESLLTWSKDAIKKPIIRTSSKLVKKEAPEMFRRIQTYMGDKGGSSGNRSSGFAQLDVAVEIVIKGWMMVELRDEVLIQLCRQTTRNPHQDSLQRGLELLCICLAFFPPSSGFLPYLQLHLNSPLDSTIASVKPVVDCVRQCQRRLERIVQTGAKRGLNKPTADDVDHARKDRFPTRRLPWIQTTLSEEILRLNGICTEGIFRIPGDTDAVNALKLQCDEWCFTPSQCLDPCVPASLLKLWYRELYEPLVPFEFYDECIEKCNDVDAAVALVDRLPRINRDVLKYLIRFLQVFAAPENVVLNKMDVNNLSMVMAPNCLRSRMMNPQTMLDNARHEMAFVRALIQHLDTTDMDGVV